MLFSLNDHVVFRMYDVILHVCNLVLFVFTYKYDILDSFILMCIPAMRLRTGNCFLMARGILFFALLSVKRNLEHNNC